MPIYVSNLDLKNNKRETLFQTFAKKQNYETIFSDEEKQKLFDLPNNVFYGKIDEKNNPVMLDIDSLVAVTSKNNTVRLCDVAAKAFSDLQDYFATARQKISSKSNFIDLFAQKGHRSLNLQYLEYFQTLNKIFANIISKENDKKFTNIEIFFDIFNRSNYKVSKSSYHKDRFFNEFLLFTTRIRISSRFIYRFF